MHPVCFCCTTSCPSLLVGAEIAISAAILLQAYRWIADGRNEQRLDDLEDPVPPLSLPHVANMVLGKCLENVAHGMEEAGTVAFSMMNGGDIAIVSPVVRISTFLYSAQKSLKRARAGLVGDGLQFDADHQSDGAPDVDHVRRP